MPPNFPRRTLAFLLWPSQRTTTSHSSLASSAGFGCSEGAGSAFRSGPFGGAIKSVGHASNALAQIEWQQPLQAPSVQFGDFTLGQFEQLLCLRPTLAFFLGCSIFGDVGAPSSATAPSEFVRSLLEADDDSVACSPCRTWSACFNRPASLGPTIPLIAAIVSGRRYGWHTHFGNFRYPSWSFSPVGTKGKENSWSERAACFIRSVMAETKF